MALASCGQNDEKTFDIPTGDLCESLIGNKDLKFKLLGDEQFVTRLVCEFASHVRKVTTSSSASIRDLERCSVVLRTLCSLTMDANIDRDDRMSRSLKCFDNVGRPMLQLFQFFVSTTKRAPIKMTVSYCIDTLLMLSNKRSFPELCGEDLCTFIVSVMMIEEDPLIVKVLKLVPLVLKHGSLAQENLVALVTALLRRVSTESEIIVKAHLPDSKEEFLYDLAFNHQSLPNVSLSHEILENIVDIKMLKEFLLRTAQIFKFMQKNNHQIVPVESYNAIIQPHLYLTLQLLFKYDDTFLNLVSLNLMDVHLEFLKPRQEILAYQNYRKLFPQIIEMLELNKSSATESVTATTGNNTTNGKLPLFLASFGRILIGMCSSYPILIDDIKEANIDRQIIAKVERLYKENEMLQGMLNIKRSFSGQNPNLLDFTIFVNYRTQETIGAELADLIDLLAIYTSLSEDCRSRVTNTSTVTSKVNLSLVRVVADLVDNYSMLLCQIDLAYKLIIRASKSKTEMQLLKKDLPWLQKNLSILLSFVDSPLYSNVLLLVRSLSRSLSILRTFFVECDSLESSDKEPRSFIPGFDTSQTGMVANFLKMLSVFAKLDKILHTFDVITNSKIKLENQNINKTTLTGTLANFILDFSSFRKTIVRSGSFSKSLSKIYQNSSFIDPATERTHQYQQYMVQLNVLQLLKNYMFNETRSNNIEILDYFPLVIILKQTFYGFEKERNSDSYFNFIKLQKKLIGFDILRNLTAGSSQVAKVVIETYEDNWDNFTEYQLPEKWFDFVIANIKNHAIFHDDQCHQEDDENELLPLIMCDDFVKMVTSLNYIENHKYITINKIEKTWFPSDELLSVWKGFLELSPEDIDTKKYNKQTFHNNLNEIKLSIIWILTNLTWRNSNYGYKVRQESDYSVFETMEKRTQILIEETFEESDTSGLMTVTDRAKYLEKFGFADVLSGMIEEYSELPNQSSVNQSDRLFDKSEPKKQANLKRFDIQNSYDLLEKVKTTYGQLLGLTRKRRQRTIMSSEDEDWPASGVGLGRSADALQAVVAAVAQRRIRPDVNRGGEGFGYDSLDTMDDDEEDADNMNLEDREVANDNDEWDRIEEDDLEFIGSHG